MAKSRSQTAVQHAIGVVASVVAVLTAAMVVDGRLEECFLVPVASLLVSCLAVLWHGVPPGPWRTLLVVVAAPSCGGFAVFLVLFFGRILSPEHPQIASPGAGFALTLIALGVGIAVVPLAALLTAMLARPRQGRR